MFHTIGRRLAILNALVVIAVIAAVGLASYLYLARKIETQADAELRSRSSSAVQLWTDTFLTANDPGVVTFPADASSSEDSDDDDSDREEHDSDEDEHDDSHSDEAREIVRSGDTIAFAMNLQGSIVATLRPVDIEGLPKSDSVDRAIQGSIVQETITLDGERVRLRTEPVLADGDIVGAIQVGMGLGPNEQVLDFVRMSTIGGLVLGVLMAVPSGWLLAGRSMRPIREAFARQRSFVADASHELRTPLTLIRAEAEYLQQSPDLSDEERAEGEAAIVREVDSMASLVSSLLQLARIDENVPLASREHIEFSDLVEATVSRLEPLAAEKGLTLRQDDRLAGGTVGDRAALQQVLTILIDNAITYTPPGGSITVRSDRKSGMDVIAVMDTGIGISQEDQQHIFDRFYRADPARTRAGGGAGLGLSIANELMKAHGGRIEVESTLHTGSTFTMVFPSS